MHFCDCGSYTEKKYSSYHMHSLLMTSCVQAVYGSHIGVNFSISSLPNNGMEGCDIRPTV